MGLSVVMKTDDEACFTPNTGSESVCVFTMGEVWKYSSQNSWALGYTISVLIAFSAVAHSLFNVPVSSAFCVIRVFIEQKIGSIRRSVTFSEVTHLVSEGFRI